MLTTNCPTCGSKVGMTNNRGTNHFIVLDNESKDQQIKDLEELLEATEKCVDGFFTNNYLILKQSYQQKYPKQ